MICGFVTPAQFAARGTQHEIRIETGSQFVGILVIESLGAGMHCSVHVRDEKGLRGTWRRDAKACDTAFQVDRYPELFQKIHPEDAVDRATACFSDGAQVNRRQLDALQDVIAQGELTDRDLSCIECSCFIPGLKQVGARPFPS